MPRRDCVRVLALKKVPAIWAYPAISNAAGSYPCYAAEALRVFALAPESAAALPKVQPP